MFIKQFFIFLFKVGETGSADNFTVTKNATFRHFNLITVSLPEIPESSRRLRRSVMDGVNGWNITLSYDGLTFGDQVTLLVYNSQKYSCETQTLTCQKLVSKDINQAIRDNVQCICQLKRVSTNN